MKVRIKKGDTVKIISGRTNDIGKTGEVIRVDPDAKVVVVQGINLRTKHQRQVQSEGKTINPGIVKLEGPLHISNVMLVCPKCKQPTRVGVSRDGEKVMRVCKKCNAFIES
ncbi:MAG TPA: 50S ribosomal protein L24 [Candidatus Gracilibacteria bacterium]|nr:50S ribosomal protein L24 [Candidatus Gracilibacteria bacterium]